MDGEEIGDVRDVDVAYCILQCVVAVVVVGTVVLLENCVVSYVQVYLDVKCCVSSRGNV